MLDSAVPVDPTINFGFTGTAESYRYQIIFVLINVWSDFPAGIIIIINSIIITPLELFTSVLADGFSLEFEWQQVSSSLQDTSQHSGRS